MRPSSPDSSSRHRSHPSRVLILGLAAAAALVSCRKEEAKQEAPPQALFSSDTSPVVARVGSSAITWQMLQRIAAQNAYDLANEEQAKLALRDAVNFEILAAEALRRGYDQEPEIKHYIRTQAVQKLLGQTVDAKADSAAAVSDEELRAYYDQHQQDFSAPVLARAQVLALLKRQGQEAAFTQKLDAVKTAIAAKELPFGELVNQFSDDPAAKTYAGMSNWLVRGEESKQYPATVLDAVFSATDKVSVAGPIEQNDWVYFVKLHERRDPQATSFEQAKPKIAQQLQRSRRLEAYNNFVGTLEKDLKVETFPDKVREAARAGQSPSSGPPMGPVSLPSPGKGEGGAKK